MSETTQMQPLPIMITGEEYVGIMQHTATLPAGAVEELRMFLKGKQHQAQQAEAARQNAVMAAAEDPKPAPKKK